MDYFDIACFILTIIGVATIAMGMREAIIADEE